MQHFFALACGRMYGARRRGRRQKPPLWPRCAVSWAVQRPESGGAAATSEPSMDRDDGNSATRVSERYLPKTYTKRVLILPAVGPLKTRSREMRVSTLNFTGDDVREVIALTELQSHQTMIERPPKLLAHHTRKAPDLVPAGQPPAGSRWTRCSATRTRTLRPRRWLGRSQKTT